MSCRHVGGTRFQLLDVGDETGPSSERGLVERNAIPLLSGCCEPGLRAPLMSSRGQ